MIGQQAPSRSAVDEVQSTAERASRWSRWSAQQGGDDSQRTRRHSTGGFHAPVGSRQSADGHSGGFYDASGSGGGLDSLYPQQFEHGFYSQQAQSASSGSGYYAQQARNYASIGHYITSVTGFTSSLSSLSSGFQHSQVPRGSEGFNAEQSNSDAGAGDSYPQESGSVWGGSDLQHDVNGGGSGDFYAQQSRGLDGSVSHWSGSVGDGSGSAAPQAGGAPDAAAAGAAAGAVASGAAPPSTGSSRVRRSSSYLTSEGRTVFC